MNTAVYFDDPNADAWKDTAIAIGAIVICGVALSVSTAHLSAMLEIVLEPFGMAWAAVIVALSILCSGLILAAYVVRNNVSTIRLFVFSCVIIFCEASSIGSSYFSVATGHEVAEITATVESDEYKSAQRKQSRLEDEIAEIKRQRDALPYNWYTKRMELNSDIERLEARLDYVDDEASEAMQASVSPLTAAMENTANVLGGSLEGMKVGTAIVLALLLSVITHSMLNVFISRRSGLTRFFNDTQESKPSVKQASGVSAGKKHKTRSQA